MKIFKKGFNYSQDGPGNRLVYHLKGCNMHCPWCSNPEGIYINIGEHELASPKEIINEAISCKPMFFENGGVTFTGGEATLQATELKEVLCGLKKESISIAIETNGTYVNLQELFCFIDYLIIDFKHPLSEKHKEITGMGNEIIKKNIAIAAKSKMDLLVRVPLIGGFNTDVEAFQGFLEFFKSINGANVKFELLKYHEYGKDKWKKCGLEYKVENAFVSEETRRNLEKKMKNIGLNVIRT